SVTGALAYALAAGELLEQVDPPDWVVVADGSGGTHGGLLAGLPASVRVIGIDVGTRPDLDEKVPELARDAARAGGTPPGGGELIVDHSRYGAGYGEPTAECLEAIRALARLEGVLLDPVYTGKAMAGLIGWAREGRFAGDDTVLFWHTGGAPALFADGYEAWLTGG
ncbi:MAG TPA: pyridoxal-phosphate dependent enzyme, partial [Acidimicrobiia bacterium]|nr:pyridoxal-phosphate dependent enzyme [Acidimicrobiia bacterium]